MFLQVLLSQHHHVDVSLPHLQDVQFALTQVQVHFGFLILEQFYSVMSWASSVARLMGNFPAAKL